ncbi:hypothetical protein P170DRAFT_479075 [Aspergillus steynii IBT 23096]|uniref:Cupin type-2 domain-containing protein n=1 Tax=Aspergillus steynii IBT 23096 TaxID=1392250 RepID=A0A2I2FZV9_9EURO|nr:uncharacterized protein P170DRAFT_479075 [Aspergillus steynii IBT 23096]PLB46154.1 hypothetical protein P170DRAFT_479075 [Aspergillus steynii IBT 23096]
MSTPEKNLRPLSRYITTHNATTGLAIFSTTLPESMPVAPIPNTAHFSLAYTTSHYPSQIPSSESDVTEYSSYLSQPPGLVISSGSVCRIVDMPPQALSPMHRTQSLDYGVVLEGEVELVLDSGETRVLKRGDVAVQRGTNHAWRNLSKEGWARMLYVLLPAEEVLLEGGRRLGEELGGMEGVRGST